MARAPRIALLDGDGLVVNVVRAGPEWAQAYAAARGLTAREVVTERELPTTPDAIRSRSCEPGARLVQRDATIEERTSGRARREAGRDVVDDFERADPDESGSADRAR